MWIRGVLYYEARIAFGLTSLLPALILPGYATLGTLAWLSRNTTPEQYELLRAFVLLLPLCSGLIAAHLMVVEREEAFDELRRSYPEPDWRVPFLRTGIAIGLALVSALVAWWIFAISSRYALTEALLPAFAPSIFLMGLGIILSNVTGNYPLAAGFIVAYWFLEFQLPGSLTGDMFLFNAAVPQVDVDPDLNQQLLIIGGTLLLIANGIYSSWRRRRGG